MGLYCHKCGAPAYIVLSGAGWYIAACTLCDARKLVKL